MFSEADHRHMARALQLAARGLCTTSPNPRVGCVLVKNNVVIGEGWHVRAGEAHAEVHALRAARAAGHALDGTTAYVTLEPCSHFGRTPPCAEALVEAGVARVVAAMTDPNPLVAGRGLARLQAAGIKTEPGLMQQEATELNIGFVSRMQRGRPWVRLKAASSLDGQTALNNGQSQWITGPEARRDGQRWRARACAILTGIGTVLADDPQLNLRDLPPPQGIDGKALPLRQPTRIIIDPRLQTPPSAKILDTHHGGPVWIAHGLSHQPNQPNWSNQAEALSTTGTILLPQANSNAQGHFDLAALLQQLGERGINELHVEAGAKLGGQLLTAGLVDELLLYLAPSLIGQHARGLFDLPELTTLTQKHTLRWHDVRQIGGDLRVIARL